MLPFAFMSEPRHAYGGLTARIRGGAGTLPRPAEVVSLHIGWEVVAKN